MAPKFGTSGLRGLVTDLTTELVAAHVSAFVRACQMGQGVFVARDLRDSSPRIAGDVIAAARAAGLRVTDCGATSTPALALAAQSARAAAVMVTGSHIPADRNGLKFYTPAGEITKAEEAVILAALDHPPIPAREAEPLQRLDPGPDYVARMHAAYGPNALAGQRVGVWSHSAVGRDLLIATLRALGAEVIEIGRSDTFIPIDTEAVSSEARALFAAAAAEHGLAAIASTDGDGDRPLLADATGRVIPGDVLGQITARTLGAQVVVTPVSSNTGVAQMGFAQVIRTKIGSPFVIAGMEAAAAGGAERVVGYEANGGFLLGFDAHGPAGPLPRLLTRDSHLPIVAALIAAGTDGLAALVAQGPQRFTAADRLQEVPTARTKTLVAALAQNPTALLTPLEAGELQSLEQTDGLRLTLTSGRIVHLRPSGNAPELRLYTEAERSDLAEALLAAALAQVMALL
ncbi:phosphomannomutase [Roseinatronobacter bogoriensis]|uniref:Phosphomannomutase n=1 Tax=Roseinatronobacter bogoriensis subsp. barguzinensis TaxID=441209 RepID=A0A2K8KDG4_9RHOB|nr:phosphomannomutase [Rhodobaca]ATX67497.1 phosphomannomutase [Rhodobaca barguzinensis]MBB4207088.1 phosphomannomutase [Rhodobaca bogoriensis DSM 18756]TDW35981.1 phosphomannomutase [Rhodobaca barguzinensis]TDY73994.1 phosphomannomutase [Rhodobaca bogoriensis DSM 18756]